MAAQREYIKCPDCNAGDRNRKIEWRKGTVGAYASPAEPADECGTCKGDGIIIRPQPATAED
jgi:hypothetical protein